MSQRNDVLAEILQQARATLEGNLDRVGAADWPRPIAEDGWTIRDVLAHLAYNQPSRAQLVRGILAGKGGAPADFDLDRFNARGVAKQQERSVAELRAILAAGHVDTLALLAGLTDADLDRKGNDPACGAVTVAEIFHLTAYHDLQHARQIRDALE